MSGNADPTIRRAAPGDADQMAALLAELGHPSTGAEVSQRLAYWLPDPMSLILVAEHGGRLVGCLRTRMDAHAFYARLGYADVCGSSGRFLKTLADPTASGS